MKILKVISTLTLTFALSAAAHADTTGGSQFPIGPDPTLTPGSLCASPDEYRYSEKIAYCRRDVDGGDKAEIIHTYDTTLGYHIEEMNRADFKIDHLIPLCFGGSNEKTNLWPQHKSVYGLTDPLENKLCQLLQQGKITQQDAIAKLLAAKANLSSCGDLSRQLDQQLQQGH